ncbi:MAG TPA: serine/threonine-protein kinase [Phycisphaerales bacterium]|nr:serine/threonine-protein kinase [Phycisphaerales bacterium]
MADDRRRARQVFMELADLPAPERDAALTRACAGDTALRAEVQALLRAEQQADGFMASPTGAAAPSAAEAATAMGGAAIAGSLHEGPGTRIGPYKLLQLIGEGGFGSVFMAEQERPVARKVALKIIKLGMDTHQVVARFEQERQALAMMDHPNIARVLDAGATDTGRPFFVMELVKGDPIVEFCDKNNLSIEDRLELFAQVCNAVQHAHTKGIIHRDIKPSNILVSTQDGKPHTKVIDFGIAKATASKLTEKTLFTEHRQLIGTPEYMSPEQAEGSMDIDTRTDVYSLGVLLYELLTGTTPFGSKELRSAAYAEIQRIIREVEPPKPSTRISHNTDTIASVAARRHTEPKRLGVIVRGELDWIVMRALEKDRQRRYETANGLAMDIRRYLAGEAVVAAPPSRTYRVRKFVARNRIQVVAVGTVAAVLVLGVIGTSGGMVWALRERTRATFAAEAESKARKRAETISEFVTAALQSSDPSAGGAQGVTVLGAMDNAVRDIAAGRFKEDPETRAALRGVIGTVLMNNARLQEAETLATQSLETLRAVHPGDHPDVADALNRLAEIKLRLGHHAEEEACFTKALEMHERLFPGDDPRVANDLKCVAVARECLGRGAEAESLAERSVQMWQRLDKGDRVETAVSMWFLAYLRRTQHPDRLEEADSLCVRAYEMVKRLFPGDHPEVAGALRNLANVRIAMGRGQEADAFCTQALDMYRRMYTGDHLDTAGTLSDLAYIRQLTHHAPEAKQLFEEALAMRRRLIGGDHLDIAQNLNNLAWVNYVLGRFADAEQSFIEERNMRRRLQGDENPSTLAAIYNIGLMLEAQGKFAEAEPYFREVMEKGRRVLGEEHRTTLGVTTDLGLLYNSMGRYQDARRLLEASVAAKRRVLGMQDPFTVIAIQGLAATYEKLDRHADALTLHRELLGLQVAAAEKPDANAPMLNKVAWSLLTHKVEEVRDPARALVLAQRACEAESAAGGGNLWTYLDTLALAQHRTGDTAKAIQTEKRAISLIPKAIPEADTADLMTALAAFEAALAEKEKAAPNGGH